MDERVEVYRDNAKEYRWRRVVMDVKREIVAESGEGYVRKIDAVRQARRLNDGVTIFDVTERGATYSPLASADDRDNDSPPQVVDE